MDTGVSNKKPFYKDSKQTFCYEISIVDAVISHAQRTMYCTTQVWETRCISLPINYNGQSYAGKGSQVWKSHSGKKKMASEAMWGWSAKFSHGWQPVTVERAGIKRGYKLLDTTLHRNDGVFPQTTTSDFVVCCWEVCLEKYGQLEQYCWRCFPSKLFRE